MTLWSMSLVFFVVSVLLGGINYITTVLNLRTQGMSLWRMPLTIWAFFVTAIIGLLSFPVLVSGLLLILCDRELGTSFYLSEIFVGGQALEPLSRKTQPSGSLIACLIIIKAQELSDSITLHLLSQLPTSLGWQSKASQFVHRRLNKRFSNQTLRALSARAMPLQSLRIRWRSRPTPPTKQRPTNLCKL